MQRVNLFMPAKPFPSEVPKGKKKSKTKKEKESRELDMTTAAAVCQLISQKIKKMNFFPLFSNFSDHFLYVKMTERKG